MNGKQYIVLLSFPHLIPSVGKDENAERHRQSDHGVRGRHAVLEGPLRLKLDHRRHCRTGKPQDVLHGLT